MNIQNQTLEKKENFLFNKSGFFIPFSSRDEQLITACEDIGDGTYRTSFLGYTHYYLFGFRIAKLQTAKPWGSY